MTRVPPYTSAYPMDEQVDYGEILESVSQLEISERTLDFIEQNCQRDGEPQTGSVPPPTRYLRSNEDFNAGVDTADDGGSDYGTGSSDEDDGDVASISTHSSMPPLEPAWIGWDGDLSGSVSFEYCGDDEGIESKFDEQARCCRHNTSERSPRRDDRDEGSGGLSIPVKDDEAPDGEPDVHRGSSFRKWSELNAGSCDRYLSIRSWRV
ncbi:hypothetical protein BD410DRAFT_790098, partial [Rickenella mellea]